MISCNEAAYLMDKKGVEKLTFGEKFKLWRHNFHCKVCRTYAKFSSRFDKVVKLWRGNPPKLSEQEKNAMRSHLQKNESGL